MLASARSGPAIRGRTTANSSRTEYPSKCMSRTWSAYTSWTSGRSTYGISIIGSLLMARSLRRAISGRLHDNAWHSLRKIPLAGHALERICAVVYLDDFLAAVFTTKQPGQGSRRAIQACFNVFVKNQRPILRPGGQL